MIDKPTKLTPVMEKALVRYPAANATPDQAWGVREGTRNALIARGLVEAIEGRTKYTNQPIYRYRRTAEGDRVAEAIWKVAR